MTTIVATPQIEDALQVAGAPAVLANVNFLDQVHLEYAQRRDAWIREERRLAGTDDILAELEQFDWEDAGAHYEGRKKIATYPNLPLQHASTITGHLAKHRPLPGKGMDFGNMGKVRARDKIDSLPSRGELVWYNVNGVGADGAQMDAWLDDLDIRAQATGHRWIMIEKPSELPRSYADEIRGLRPFAVEYSPLLVTNWMFANGQLRWAIVRVQTQAPKVEGGTFNMTNYGRLGYYLLVAEGETALGDAFAEGGWWTFTAQKGYIAHERWLDTLGQIPLFRHFGRMSYGTTEKPASSASDTMELGQLAVSMMNTRSAREFDFRDACASKIYFLGADAEVMKVVVDGWKSSSLVAVPPRQNPDGSAQEVTVYDGSAGAVVGAVSDALEKAQWETARQLSIAKVTSTPDSSGASKNAGFAEASAPDLTRRAMLREQTENTLLYFFELRFGFMEPRAYSVWPREFDLEPLVDDIDAMFDTMRRSSVTSGTMEVELIIQSLVERGLITDTTMLATIRTELTQAYQQKLATAQSDRALLRGTQAGNPLTGAASAKAEIGGAPGIDPGAPRVPKLPNDPTRPAVTLPQPSTSNGSATPASNPDPTAGAGDAHQLPAVHESSAPAVPQHAGSSPRPLVDRPSAGSGNPSPDRGAARPADVPHEAGNPPAPHADAHPPVGRSPAPELAANDDTAALASLTAQVSLLLAQMATLQALILQAKAEDDAEDAAEEEEDDPVLAAIAALAARMDAYEAPTTPVVAPKSDVLVIPMQNGGDLEITVKRDANNLMTGASVTRPGA